MTRLPALALVFVTIASGPQTLRAQIDRDPKIDQAVARGLDYLAREQRKQGYWEANGGQYRVAMTALATTALLCEGSTTMRGKYAENIRSAVDFLLDCAQPNGLIGYKEDYRYTYGHGFSMLCLSQVFGEEEDADRRERIRKVLTKAVEFCAYAQTTQGGWGYVSAKDGNDFDEGSTCVTQVQGLRACRNAGLVVPGEVIERAKKYIHDCLNPDDGGVQYSIRGGGSRPPITAAAVASMYSAGDYDTSDDVKRMMEYCRKNIWPGGGIGQSQSFGHWHYMHMYYAQVMYRHPDEWPKYYGEISQSVLRSQSANGSWSEGSVGPVYVTAICAIILQLDKDYLPIFQR
jgi:hypothetical protein